MEKGCLRRSIWQSWTSALLYVKTTLGLANNCEGVAVKFQLSVNLKDAKKLSTRRKVVPLPFYLGRL